MKQPERLVDHRHPLVERIAHKLTDGYPTDRARLKALFLYVRDQIPFGFPRVWDPMRASEVMAEERGYCITKATLLTALCRAAGIPARLHFADIDTHILYGILPDLMLSLLPKYGSHAWTEVKIEGEWKAFDSYINDRHFCRGCRVALKESRRDIGFSLACSPSPCSCAFNFDKKGFAQMGAVVKDRGVWHDTAEFMNSDGYRPLPRHVRLLYPLLRPWVNRRIERLRRRGKGLLVEVEREEEMMLGI